MQWLRDASGRFPRRPHYATSELESVCADLLRELRRMRAVHRSGALSTDDLSVLVEHYADLDLYADLPPELDGVTEFARHGRPTVRVAARLSAQSRLEPRLRTTLAHELVHVVLHNFIWWFDPGVAFDPKALSPRCSLRTQSVDWMEWQANYCAGALLVPAADLGLPEEAVWERSAHGRELVRGTQRRFEVSPAVASIRLRQLGWLSQRPSRVLRVPQPWRR